MFNITIKLDRLRVGAFVVFCTAAEAIYEHDQAALEAGLKQAEESASRPFVFGL